jgi:hypothetical protein
MITNISELFKRTKPVDETYIFLLNIIQYTSEKYDETKDIKLADHYRDQYVVDKFIYKIKESLIFYKKFDSLTNKEEEKSNKTLEDRQMEFKILAAQIDCLGGIVIGSKENNSKDFLADNVHEEILSILSLHKVDPVLLISCCRYAKKYFSVREVINDQMLLENKLVKIDNCTKLLTYLNDTGFKTALEQ